MNFFEEQLRFIVGNQPSFENAKYIGRACIASLDGGVKMKAEFVINNTINEYEALKLTAINPKEDKIDNMLLHFGDCFNKVNVGGIMMVPSFREYDGKAKWYIEPSIAEKAALGDAVQEYAELFEQQKAMGNMLTEELKPGDSIRFVPQEPLFNCSQIEYTEGIFDEIDLKHQVCFVSWGGSEKITVPFRYVLGVYDSNTDETHFGCKHTKPLFGMNEIRAYDLLCEARNAYSTQQKSMNNTALQSHRYESIKELEQQLGAVVDGIISKAAQSQDGEYEVPIDDIADEFKKENDFILGHILVDMLDEREEISIVDARLGDGKADIKINSEYRPTENAESKTPLLKLKDLLALRLEDVYIFDKDEEHNLAVIVELDNNTLTAEGKEAWSDVLNADVHRISDGDEGIAMEVSGVDVERLCDFSYMLAGHCSYKDYEKWVNDTPDSQDFEMKV